MLFRKRKQPSHEEQSSLTERIGQVRAVWQLIWGIASPKKRRRMKHDRSCRRKASPLLESLIGLQGLEARLMLTGPTANNDQYYAESYTTLNIPAYAGVLANDTGGSGPLSAVLISGPSSGTVTLNSDGSFSYTNTSYAMSDDDFTYEAFDGTNYSSPATVDISFSGTYQPYAEGQSYSVLHDHTLTVSAADGALNGDTDPNGIHLTAVLASGPADGSVTLNSDGSFNYTPDTDFVGIDTFYYQAYDGNQYSYSASVSINVTNTPPFAYDDHYSLTNDETLTVSAADGALANDVDGDGDTLTASLTTSPSHGSLTFHSDGSFSYTPASGWIGMDSFTYTASDGPSSSGATVYLDTEYAVASIVDETTVPVDTIHVARQILSDPFAGQAITSPLPAGGSGGTTISAAPADGAPATAHNLSLVYDNVLQYPDQVIEADVGLTLGSATSDTLTASLNFNGVTQPEVYFDMSTLYGSDPQVHIAMQVSTSDLATGRYPYTLTINGGDLIAPATMSGFVNVVNDADSPFGTGWDMPGLLHLFNNSVSGVPAGVLMSTGDGGAYYFTENDDGSFSSPAGPYAFATLASVTGGGWQLKTHDGVTFNFNSGGYLTSRVERTGETTEYTWTSDEEGTGELTAITDQFGRSIDLSYAGGLLSSIQDFAGHTWSIDHSLSGLVSITEPNPGGGAPVWNYAYAGGEMSSVEDPNGNVSDFNLDAYDRLASTDLPDSLTTGAASEQDFGYGSTSSASPAALTMQASVVPTLTNAAGDTSSYQTSQLGEVTSETNAAGLTTTIQRNSNGLPTVITLPPPTTGAAHPVTDIYYTSTGDETYATGAQPTFGTYTYSTDSFGQWATFTDSLGHEWLRTFDSSGDILTETTPSGNEASWTYNSYGQPLTMTLPAPNDASGTVTTHYYYDSYDRLTEILWPDGTSQHVAYNSDDFETSFEDEDGNTTVTARDVLNRPTSVTNAASEVTSTTYDKDNNIVSTETPLGEVTSYEYNALNELVQETLPPQTTGGTAPTETFTYNANGDKLTSTDSLGRVTSWAYNDLDEVTAETLPPQTTGGTDPTIEFAYNNLGQQVSETNQLGGVSFTNYGNTDINQVTSESAPPQSGSGTGPTTTFSFDADGRQDVVTNALSQSTSTSFTVDGQVSQTEDNLGNITSFVYGHGGELLSTTDPLSHSASDEYDSRYRLVQSTDANGGVSEITLDGVGNQVKLVDSDSNETDWSFNSLNLPVSETNALGTTYTSYNADSQVSSIEDADGRVRDFVYNGDQQLTAENWMSGSTIVATMSYGFDLAGELTSASDSNSAYAFAYNGDGAVTSVDNYGTPGVPDVVLTAGYNLAGLMTSQSATIAGTADYLNSYTFNGDQELTKVTQQDQTGGNVISPKESDYSYDALGLVTSTADFNTLSGPRSDVLTGAARYDGDNRLTSLAYTSDAGANTIDTFGYRYNAAGLITSFSSSDGTASYSYDPTNQLTAASYTTSSGGHQPANESYSFTANGNRDSSGYSTGDDNLMSSDGTYDYSYDANGNLVSRTQIASTSSSDYRTTYTWDYRNRLTDVENYDNDGVLTQHVHFIYDVLNALIGEEVDSTGSGSYDQIERFVISGGQPALEFDGDGDLIERNLIAPNPAGTDAVMAQEAVTSTDSGGAVLWMVDDKLGTPRDDVDNSGTLVNHEVFSSFGEIAYQSDPSIQNWAGFGGGHFDPATGLVHDGARFYDSGTGRWLSMDPMGFSAGDMNLTRYVGNNVTNDTDPTGLFDPSMGYSTQDGVMTTWITLADASGSISTNAVMQSQLGDTAPDSALAWMPATSVPAGTSNGSWLDGYASNFGTAYSGIGNTIYNSTPLSDATLANASDTAIFGVTAAISAGAVLGAIWAAPAVTSAVTSTVGAINTGLANIAAASIPITVPAWLGGGSMIAGGGGAAAISAGGGMIISGTFVANAAVIAGFAPLIFMAANGNGEDGADDEFQEPIDPGAADDAFNELGQPGIGNNPFGWPPTWWPQPPGNPPFPPGPLGPLFPGPWGL